MVVEGIDVVGLGEGRALAIEVKWTEFKEAKRIMAQLDVKAGQIRGVEERILGVMAEKINGKEGLRDEGFIVLDLEDVVRFGDWVPPV